MSFFTNQIPEYAAYEIGDWTYGNPRVMEYGEPTTLKIRKFCSIAEGVIIMLGGNHRGDLAPIAVERRGAIRQHVR